MQRRHLGGTGISVSEFALGAMNFGAMGNTDHDESVRMIHTALDAGINLVDTADVYSMGESETIVGKALRGRRDDVVLATKFGLPMDEGPDRRGASPRWIRRAVEDSLERLATDYIDLYQLHRRDPATDIDETLAVLSELVREGKVRAIGTSSFAPDEIVEAQWTAERRGHHRFRTEQPPYSLFVRGIENRVLPTAQRYGMGVLTFAPLNSGWLSGRADPTATPRNAGIGARLFDMEQPGVRAKAAALEQLTALAGEAGMPLAHLALAFVRAHPAVTSVLLGPRRPDQLDDLLAAADVHLDDDVLDRIDDIVPPGVDFNVADLFVEPTPAIQDKTRRRRPRVDSVVVS
jgi:aryl-alcohol dehydrogenase-like predicted oxidoreductase